MEGRHSGGKKGKVVLGAGIRVQRRFSNITETSFAIPLTMFYQTWHAVIGDINTKTQLQGLQVLAAVVCQQHNTKNTVEQKPSKRAIVRRATLWILFCALVTSEVHPWLGRVRQTILAFITYNTSPNNGKKSVTLERFGLVAWNSPVLHRGMEHALATANQKRCYIL